MSGAAKPHSFRTGRLFIYTPSLDSSFVSSYRLAMKFGDQLKGTIHHIDDLGRGVFDFSLPQDPDETRTVAIPFTAIDDEVTATFARRERGTWIGKLESVHQPSPDRISPYCPHAGICGGCLWQHMAYEAQVHLKREMINRAFAKAGHEEKIESVIPSSEIFYYRNRMDCVIGWNGSVGLKEHGSWGRYVDLSTCLLLDETTPEILKRVRELMQELNLEPWDAKKHTGLMRYVVIRLGKNTNERMITLVVKDATRLTQHIGRMLEQFAPLSTTLYLGENPEITDLSVCKTFKLLHGKEYLTEEVNGLRYDIHPNSFFQTNTHMAGELQRVVLNFLGDLHSQRVLDLYCGLGFFGIACAKQGVSVLGQEIDESAIKLAKNNAEMNDVKNQTRFVAGPVENIAWQDEKPDAVILDPPRAGLHPRVIKTLLEKQPPTIVYVSCNYHRLVEELKQFKSTYNITEMRALDLFPHTPHVEVVTKLTKR